MKSQPVEGIQPEVLVWARNSIGLSIDDVASSMKRSIDEVLAWERGDAAPTYPQLEKLAYKLYKRPLAVFFFPEPPHEVSPRREFRSLPDADLEGLYSDTLMHVRKGHAFQISLKEVFDNKNPVQERIWKECPLDMGRSVESQAKKIRDFIEVGLEEQSSADSDEEALKLWRSKIEEYGVFVFKAAFKQKEISGFCLSDEQFPLIYLNNSTTKTRQIFSLFHELAHILLNTKSISKFEHSYFHQLPENAKKVEVFCNAIAAEILIPSQDFNRQTINLKQNIESIPDEEIERIAKRYSVSREAILRRFLDQGRISAGYYSKKAEEWTAQKRPSSGGNWYASTNAYLSNRYAKEVISQYYRHKISVESASELLGIKAKNFSGLEERILRDSTS